MAHYLMLHGFTREERHRATWELREAIGACGGAITAATVFSNKALTLTFEMPAGKLDKLGAGLRGASLVLYDESDAALHACRDELANRESAELVVLLNIAFVNDDPDEKTEVPAVPG